MDPRALASKTLRQLRVLVITPDFPPVRGGIQTLLHRVVANVSDTAYRVVTLDSPGAAEFDRANGLDVHRVAAGRWGQAARISALNAEAIRLALRWNPD